MSEPIWYSVVDLNMNPGFSEAFTLYPLSSILWCVQRHITPGPIVLHTFTVKGKHEGPVLGIWPLSFPNILKLTFLPGAT